MPGGLKMTGFGIGQEAREHQEEEFPEAQDLVAQKASSCIKEEHGVSLVVPTSKRAEEEEEAWSA